MTPTELIDRALEHLHGSNIQSAIANLHKIRTSLDEEKTRSALEQLSKAVTDSSAYRRGELGMDVRVAVNVSEKVLGRRV